MDWPNEALIYSQQFPEKSLDGKYIFESKVIGQPLRNAGNWSLVLYDYSQTTTVKRVGGPGQQIFRRSLAYFIFTCNLRWTIESSSCNR